MTTLALWLMLLVGASLFGGGCFYGWTAKGKQFMSLGLTYLILAGALLLRDTAFRTPAYVLCAAWLVAMFATSSREAIGAVRTELLLAAGAVLGLLMIPTLPSGTPPAVRTLLIVAVAVLAASFIVIGVVRATRALLQARAQG